MSKIILTPCQFQAYRLGGAQHPVILCGNKNSLISEGVYHQSHFFGVRCGLSEYSFILHHKIIGFWNNKF